jgi:hypothetical protein
MAKQKTLSELDKLKQKQVDLAQRIKAAETAEKAKNVKRDIRRYAITGRIALTYMQSHPQTEFASALLGMIGNQVKGASDRALFGLTPLNNKKG